MKYSFTTLAVCAAVLTVSACSWMPEGDSAADASHRDNYIYGHERTSRSIQSPAPTPALVTTTAPAPMAAPAAAPEPTPAPMSSAEPMVTPAVSK